MKANKISLNGEILLDLTQDTATEADVAVGKTFHKADGTPSVGALIPKEDLDAELTEQEELIADLKDVLTSGGSGGSGSDEWIGDGKTHLWIEIATEGRMDVPLYFFQSVANDVTIDWGDGSASQTLSGIGDVNTKHTYASIGKYIITLDSSKGFFALGYDSSSYCVIGSTSDQRYKNMLKRVEIGNSETIIRQYTFRGCYYLSSIKISNSVESINGYAFQNCYSLSSIDIPDSVVSISQYAFENCYSDIKIPNSVTYIGASAFSGCRFLSSIEIPDRVTSIQAYTFSGCSALSNITIPDSVESIFSYAFQNCYSLSNITIPSGVTSIGGSAFQNCYYMQFYDFTKHTSVPTLSGTNAFQGIPSDCEIRVPMALVDEWKAATNWATYAGNIVGV